MNRLTEAFRRVVNLYASRHDEGDLEYWKSLSFHAVAFSGLSLGFFCFLPGMIVFFRTGRSVALAAYAALFALVLAAVIYRGFSVKAKALIVSALFFVTGVAALAIAGPTGQRGVGMIASALLCSLYVGFAPSLGFSVLGFVVGLVAGILSARGVIHWEKAPDVSMNAWVLQSINIFIVSLMLSIASSSLIKGTAKSFAALLESEARNKASLAEKEALLRELYHRTNNNMQVITSMIRLHSRELAAPEDARVFLDVTGKIGSMALVHQMLYESENLSYIDSKPYLGRLVELLLKGQGVPRERVSVDLAVENSRLLLDTALPLGLALSELVLNGLQHAFPGGREGKIAVALRPEGEELVLEVSDDGVGLPEGFDIGRDGHLGLKSFSVIVRDQLQGSVEIERGNGLRYRVRMHAGLYRERV